MLVRSKIFHILFIILFFSLVLNPLVAASESEKLWDITLNKNKNDAAKKLVLADDGGFVIAGYTNSVGAGGFDFWLVKIANNQSVVWNYVYGGAEDEVAYGIEKTSDGYLITGYAEGSNRNKNFLLIKTDLSGEGLWDKQYGGIGSDIAVDIINLGDEGFVIAGNSKPYKSKYYDAVLIKIDPEGNLKWTKNYSGVGNDFVYSVIKTSDGGFALAGETYNDTIRQGWLIKTDKNGNMIFNKTFGGIHRERFYDLIQTSDKGFALAGETNSYGAGDYDFWLLKTDENGTELWNRTYGSKGEDRAYTVSQDKNNSFLIGGHKKNLFTNNFYLVNVNYEGFVCWSKDYSKKNNDIFCYDAIKTNDSYYAMTGVVKYLTNTGFYFTKINKSKENVDYNLKPICDAKEDLSSSVGETVFFEGTGYDSDGEIITYSWDFNGDGLYDFNSNISASTNYVYESPGQYKAYLKVIDNNNSESIDMKLVNIEGKNDQIVRDDESILSYVTLIFLIITIIALWFIDKKGVLKKYRFFKKWDKYNWLIFYSFIILVILKLSISFIFQTPKLFSDEHSYAIIASEIVSGNLQLLGDIPSQIPITHLYPAGYSYFLTPAFIFGQNMSNVYYSMIFINIILSTLVLIPVFLIMKHFVSRKIAFFTSLLVATIPVLSVHTYLILSENAMYLMFLVSCFLVIKMFSVKNFDKTHILLYLISCLSVFALLAIKTTGLAMILAMILLLYYKMLREFNLKSIIYGYIAIPFIIVLELILLAGKTNNFGYNVSYYLNEFSVIISNSDKLLRFITVFANEISYLTIMSYIVFMIFTIFLIFYWKKFDESKKRHLSVLILYGLLSIIFLAFITSNHIYNSNNSVYSRYISIGLPIIFMLGVIGADHYLKIKNRTINLQMGGLLTVFSLFALIFFPTNIVNIENNLDLYWINFLRIQPYFFVLILGLPMLIFFLLNHKFEKDKRRKKSKKTKIFLTTGVIFLISFISLSGVLSAPNINYIHEVDQNISLAGYNDIGLWIMNKNPQSNVIYEDVYSFLSSQGPNSESWYYIYTSMHFYLPFGTINVLNRSEMLIKLEEDNCNYDYLITTHDISSDYAIFDTIAMNIPVSKSQTQQVKWYIYKF